MMAPTGSPDQLPDVLSRYGIASEGSTEFGDTTLTVEVADWVATLACLREKCGYDYFDWLSAVDDAETFSVFCHVLAVSTKQHVLVRTSVSRTEPSVPTITGVYRGAAWHERETFEMFGIEFLGHEDLRSLLLPDGFEGHPLRKDFVLTSRVSKVWPGAKEPGESGDGSPSRRRMQPPGVPEPSWGPRQSDQASIEDANDA